MAVLEQRRRNRPRLRQGLGSSRRLMAGGKAQVKKRVDWLKKRYGSRYATAMLVVTVASFFSPIPATSLVGIALIVLVAEMHRAVRRNRHRTATGKVPMSIDCDVIVDRSATSAQLTALGIALWRWCHLTTKRSRIYQYLDSQVLADLIAGKLPSSGQTPEQASQRPDGVHVRLSDDESHSREAAIAGLRREVPAGGTVDIVVAGISWRNDGGSPLPCPVA
jgi:hypothetical protein